MPRTVFETAQFEGVHTTRIAAACATRDGTTVFLGTQEGALVAYEIQAGARSSCMQLEVLRNPTRDRQSIAQLSYVESFRVLFCVTGSSSNDGQLLAFEALNNHNYSSLHFGMEVRGVGDIAVQEPSRLVAVLQKRKVTVCKWENRRLEAFREVSLEESPRMAIFLNSSFSTPVINSASSMCLAFRKKYILLDAGGGRGAQAAQQLLFKTEREQRKPIIVRLPMPQREEEEDASGEHDADAGGAGGGSSSGGLLLSNGTTGVVVYPPGGPGEPIIDAASGYTLGTMRKEVFRWSEPPLAATVAGPFLLALLARAVEVHDVKRAELLQTMALSGAVAMTTTITDRSMSVQVLCATAASLVRLRMVPLEVQVDNLVSHGAYEDALGLCAAVVDKAFLGNIDEQGIHERYAQVLFNRADYDEAMEHFALASTRVIHVVSLIPPLLPKSHATPAAPGTIRANLQDSGLARAAQALVSFLEGVRARAIEHRRLGAAALAGNSARRGSLRGNMAREQLGLGMGLGLGQAAEVETARKNLELIDTSLVLSYLACSPPRRQRIIDLLKGLNEANVDDCAPVLAAQGSPYAEALLWLYRSRGAHRRALGLLTKERCVGTAGRKGGKGDGKANWSLAEFHQWTASYLEYLWKNMAKDELDVPIDEFLSKLKLLLEAEPELGVQVVLRRKYEPALPLEALPLPHMEVVTFLESISLPLDATSPPDRSYFSATKLPLINSGALAARYLENVIYGPSTEKASADRSEHARPALDGSTELHNKLAFLLLEGLLSERKEGDPGLADLYQGKLRRLLRDSRSYDADTIISLLPKGFYLEQALLLSHLGRHREVLRIYVRQIEERGLAEEYCDRIWRRAAAEADGSLLPAEATSDVDVQDDVEARLALDLDVYLDLVAVHLEGPGGEDDLSGKDDAETLQKAIGLLEKYYNKVDPTKALKLLPAEMPVQSVLQYLRKSLRYTWSEQRRQQVTRQLLRVQEVKVKKELIDEQVQKVVIDENTICPVCGRPIGTSAILRYPNGVVVHLSCGSPDLSSPPNVYRYLPS